MLTAPWVQRAWDDLADAMRTGETTFARIHGVGFWDYLSAHPEDEALFDAAMSGGAAARALALSASRDLSSVSTVFDVGGGQGRLLATLLKSVPSLRGVLVDRPEVIANANEVLKASGVADRCEITAGDFFAEVPPGGDAYILAQIIHDWADAEALTILRTCHRAMALGARLWVIEQVLPPGDETVRGGRVDLNMLDLNMLVLFGGGARERTADEYQQLLEAAGFGEVMVLPTETSWSIVEAVRR